MPIRILFTINNLKTAGMKHVLADLVAALDPQQFAPAVVVNQRTGSRLEQQVESRCPAREIVLRVPRRPRLAFPFRVLRSARQLRGLADVAHSFDYASDWTEGLVMKLAGIPWIIEKTNLLWDERKWAWKCGLAARIVCLSEAQRRLMHRWNHKIEVIPTGIDVDRFAQARPMDRAAFRLNKEHIVLVSVAHLVEVKGHRELLRAFAAVRAQYRHLRLLLAGEGEDGYTRELKALAHELGVAEEVRFLGGVEDIPGLLKLADGMILATRNSGRREGFGAAIIEAMAAGLPVIATRSGGPEEIVVDGATGWLVDAQGMKPLAGAIREWAINGERRARYGAAGHSRARERFHLAGMIKRLAALYCSVAHVNKRHAV